MPLSMTTSMETITGIEMERVNACAYHIHFARQTSIPFKHEINFAKFHDQGWSPRKFTWATNKKTHLQAISLFFFGLYLTHLIREGEHVRGRVASFATCHHVVVDWLTQRESFYTCAAPMRKATLSGRNQLQIGRKTRTGDFSGASERSDLQVRIVIGRVHRPLQSHVG